MKCKFLTFTFLLFTSFQVMANGKETPFDKRQYIVKSIKLNSKIREGSPISTHGTEIISTVRVQAIGDYSELGIFAKNTVVVKFSGQTQVEPDIFRGSWNAFDRNHIPPFSERPKNGEIIDINDDDGSLTLFAIRLGLGAMAEGKDKNKLSFFHRVLESKFKLKIPKNIDKNRYYKISNRKNRKSCIAGYATFINNQPLAGLSADDFPVGDYAVQSIRFNPLLTTTKNPTDLDWFSEVTVKDNGSLVTLQDTNGFLTQASLNAWKESEFDRNGNSLQSRLIDPCIQVFNSITKNSDPFAVAGKEYIFSLINEQNAQEIWRIISIHKPIINKNPLAGINFEDAVYKQPSSLTSGVVSPFFSRFVQVSNNQATFFSFYEDRLDCKIDFSMTMPLTIDVSKPVSNIILNELRGGNLSLGEDKLHIEKNSSLVLETGDTIEHTAKHAYGPLEKLIECFEEGNFLAYRALYTMPGLSVSMGPLFHKDLDKAGADVPGNWSSVARKKAAQHFDKLFTDKLSELAGNT